MIDSLNSKYPYNSPYAFQENKFGKGVELEGLELGDFVKGYLVAKIDNYSLGLINLRSTFKPNNRAAYNSGQDVGDVTTIVEGATLDAGGTAGMGTGGLLMATGLEVEVASGGTATIVAGPTAATGALVGAGGAASKMFGKMLQSSGSSNYGSQKGREKSDASKNEKHGDGGRGKSKAEKQIESLKEQAQGATRKEREKINQKIKNLTKDAERKKQGEEHSRTIKR